MNAHALEIADVMLIKGIISLARYEQLSVIVGSGRTMAGGSLCLCLLSALWRIKQMLGKI